MKYTIEKDGPKQYYIARDGEPCSDYLTYHQARAGLRKIKLGCEGCGSRANTSYSHDPGLQEMQGIDRLIVLCSKCYHNSAMDI